MRHNLVNDDAASFCKLFAQRIEKDDPNQSELLFHSMFAEETEGLVGRRQKNMFRRFCKELVQMHRFDVILWLVYSAFCRPDQYNLPLLQELLQDIKVREDYSLAQLCQDFALNMYNATPWKESIPEDTDLYHHFPEGVCMDEGDNPTARKVLPLTLLQKVYCLPTFPLADVGEEGLRLDKETVDQVAQCVWQNAAEKHAAECRDVDETNQKYQEWGVDERQVVPEFQELDRQKAMPGAMLPFLMNAELEYNMPVYYHILEQYVLPALVDTPWERATEEERCAIDWAMYYYADYLQAVWWRELPAILYPQLTLQKDFVYEALGKGDPARYYYVTPELKDYCTQRRRLCGLWVNALEKWGERLRSVLHERNYVFHVFTAAFLLYFGGEEEEARHFLLRHVYEMNDNAEVSPYGLILLIRCVLDASHLDEANALYGFFSYQVSRAERDRLPIIDCSRKMVAFLREAEEYIRRSNRHAIREKLAYHDILFGDGKILEFLNRVSAQLNNDVLSVRQFQILLTLTDAFSYPTGVRLKLLGLPNYDNYDKLEVHLPEQLRKLGESCANKYKKGTQFYAATARCEQLRNINIYLQNHLFKLQCGQVKENLQRVTDLKKNLPADMSETEREALIEQIGQIAEDLMGMMLVSRQGRGEVERELTMLREEFEQTYLPGGSDLLEKLPETVRDDVQNYLVTSALVFRMMENQKDELLDYSAALISMTKALELVMHHVYTRLDVKYDESFVVQETDKKKEKERKEQITEIYFNKKLEPREKLTLRPYVEILSNDRFTLWGMDRVLDIDMLAQFGDIQLHVEKKDGGFVYASFGSDADKNRKCFKKALHCICDNYRNRSAHPNVVTLVEVEECRQLLIAGQKLLWILLAILK